MKPIVDWSKYLREDGTYNLQRAYDMWMRQFHIRRYSGNISSQLCRTTATSEAGAQKIIELAVQESKEEWLETRPPWYERWWENATDAVFAVTFVAIMLISDLFKKLG